jgi:hypothetical protein
MEAWNLAPGMLEALNNGQWGLEAKVAESRGACENHINLASGLSRWLRSARVKGMLPERSSNVGAICSSLFKYCTLRSKYRDDQGLGSNVATPLQRLQICYGKRTASLVGNMKSPFRWKVDSHCDGIFGGRG